MVSTFRDTRLTAQELPIPIPFQVKVVEAGVSIRPLSSESPVPRAPVFEVLGAWAPAEVTPLAVRVDIAPTTLAAALIVVTEAEAGVPVPFEPLLASIGEP